MTLNVITPSEPKDPAAIYLKYKVKDDFKEETEGILILCFLGFFLGFLFKIIEFPCVSVLALLSVYLTAKNGEINIMQALPLIMMLLTTTGMAWYQQKIHMNKQLNK